MLKITKQLNYLEAERIKKLGKIEKFLFNLEDNKFFLEDFLSTKTKMNISGNNSNYLLKQKLGKFDSSEYEIIKFPSEYRYSRPIKRLEGKNEIDIKIVQVKGYEPIFNPDSPATVIVSAEDIYAKFFNLNPMEEYSKGNILAVANYFYNKFSSYKKIYKILQKNKEKLSKNISKMALEDLLLYFSVESIKTEIKDYSLPKKNIKKEYLDGFCEWYFDDTQFEKKDREGIVGHMVLPHHTDSTKPRYKDVELFITLEVLKNTLILNITAPHEAVIKEDEKFSKFLVEKINDYLKDLEQMTNFGLSILDKFKSKILISNT